MHRKLILEQIATARTAHLQWWDALKEGLADATGVDEWPRLRAPEPGFDRWYVAMQSYLGDLPAYRAIEQPRHQLEQHLREIESLLRDEDPRWSRLLGFDRKLKADRHAAIKREHVQLKRASDQLVMRLSRLEAAVCELDEIDLLALEPAAT
ncbi:MAG: hypothetical protein ACFCUJ_14775 [Thiotrichales bacterium]